MGCYFLVEGGNYSPQVTECMLQINLHRISHSSTGYAKAANILWDMALKSGDYPIFGICLGFNLMATLSNNNGVKK